MFDGIKRLLGVQSRDAERRRQREALEAFWAFWVEREAEFGEATGKTVPEATKAAISAAVGAIHPDLGWCIGSGLTKDHSFTLTGQGDPELRVIAERWRALAPEVRFELFTARPAEPETKIMGLEMRADGGPTLAYAELAVGIERDDDRRLLHLDLHHPALREMPADERAHLGILMLDHALGEDAVERWIGQIDFVEAPVEDAVDLVGLRAAVAELGEVEAVWVVADYEDAGYPMILMTCPSLKRWDHPRLDTCCEVIFGYRGGADRLPTEDLQDLFGAVEDELLALVENIEEAEHFATLTGGHARRHFIYVDGESMAGARIQAWGDGKGRGIRVNLEEDPGWDLLPRV